MRLVKCPVCKNPIPKGMKQCSLCGSTFNAFQYFKMNHLGKVIILILIAYFTYTFTVVIKQNDEIKKHLEKTPQNISVIEKLEKNYKKLNPLQKKLVRKSDIDLIKKRYMAEYNREIVENKVMTLYFENGSKEGIYQGQVLDGKPNGIGKFEYYDENMRAYSYEGEFDKGTINGKGVLVLEGGEIREGTFRNGVLMGKAYVYMQKDPSVEKVLVFEGEYVNDVRHGYGILYNEYGNPIYKGEFHNNLPNQRSYVDDCIPVNYDALYENIDEYWSRNIMITGIISHINISNDLNVTYVVTPRNNYGHYIFINNVGEYKEFTIGNEVTLYGICTGITQLTDSNGNVLQGIGMDTLFIRR